MVSFRTVRGVEKVLAQKAALADLAERCGQAGTMDHLRFHLYENLERAKEPRALLLGKPGEPLTAAVLLYEYCLARVPTGIYMSADFAGQRTVLAPERSRGLVARQAAEFLLSHGAFLASLSISSEHSQAFELEGLSPAAHKYFCATRTHIIRRTLELRETYEATLASMGLNTRRNFRRQTRKVDEVFAPVFTTEPDLSERDFLALNRDSAFPVPTSTCLWRFREARRLPGSIFAGLRAKDGRWLSLLGGRHNGDLTDVDWQFNHKQLQGYSMVTAMRAYLIQHEIARGTRFLRFDGGTAHPMHLAFVQESVSDLLLARHFLGKKFITHFIPDRLTPNSFLGNFLRSDALVWHR